MALWSFTLNQKLRINFLIMIRILPVVIHVNDYTVELFNGDDGLLLGSGAYFQSEEGVRQIARSRLPKHRIGYATTIHRCQGSELIKWRCVAPGGFKIT